MCYSISSKNFIFNLLHSINGEKQLPSILRKFCVYGFVSYAAESNNPGKRKIQFAKVKLHSPVQRWPYQSKPVDLNDRDLGSHSLAVVWRSEC